MHHGRPAFVVLLAALSGACADDAAAPPDAMPAPDAPAPDAPPSCRSDPPGAGTQHVTTIASDETWEEAGNPHVIPADLNVQATLTLAPCVVVHIGAQRTVSVRAGGRIVAQGEATRRVTIGRTTGGAAWASLRAVGGTLALVHTVVDGGGDPLNTTPIFAAALDIRGQSDLPPQPILHAEHLEITGSASQGLFLGDGGGFSATSTDVRVSGSAGHPVHSWARAAGTLPSGDYTGNGVDEILLSGSGANLSILEDITFHARGVPYRVGGGQLSTRLDVGAVTGLATLTLEPGVTIRFNPSGLLFVEPSVGTAPARGALVAVGTAAAPIVLTSAAATPAAGDWLGVWFGQTVAPTTHLSFVHIEYAGGPSQSGSSSCVPAAQVGPNDAALRILGGAPVPRFIDHSVIAHSARHGIDRGYRSEVKHDFLETNSFTDVAGCMQTFPQDANGGCPEPVPCPQ